jgi:hypothetical protein
MPSVIYAPDCIVASRSITRREVPDYRALSFRRKIRNHPGDQPPAWT